MPWVKYSLTSHSLIFHSTELIVRKDGVSIGQLSEEALESCNKDVRNYREFLSRKCGYVVNLTDTFNRLFERSDLMVAEIVRQSLAKQSRRIRPKISVLTEEDAIVESILACD